MTQAKTLDELIEVSTSIIDRLEVASRAELTAEEVLALNTMKNQVELIVTDLMDIHTHDPVPQDEVLALQGLLIKLHQATTSL